MSKKVTGTSWRQWAVLEMPLTTVIQTLDGKEA